MTEKDNIKQGVIDRAKKPLTDRPPTYIVTGFPRSGTSMMMRALDEGGIAAARADNDTTHLELEEITGYLPNPDGFYELGRGSEPWFFPGEYAGKAVKMELSSTAVMAPGQRYRIILMWRDPEAIAASLETYLAALRVVQRVKPQLLKARETIKQGMYEEMMTVAGMHLRNRRDVEQIIEARYEDILAHAEEFFRKLAEEAKWPLDPQVAASIPQQKYNRAGGMSSEEPTAEDTSTSQSITVPSPMPPEG